MLLSTHNSGTLKSRKVFKIEGREFPRIACGYEQGEYGDFVLDTSFDEHESNEGVCVDCGAPSGFLHIPGCECEQCPRCGEQALGCPCNYDACENWKPQTLVRPSQRKRSSQINVQGLLFKTGDFAFLDYRLFEDLTLPKFEDCPDGSDIAARLIAKEPALAELPKDATVFDWLLRRINYLSSGRLTLDPEDGDEGYYPLTILVTEGPRPVAVLEFEGNDYGISCYARGETAAVCNELVSVFVDACAAEFKQTRRLNLPET